MWSTLRPIKSFFNTSYFLAVGWQADSILLGAGVLLNSVFTLRPLSCCKVSILVDSVTLWSVSDGNDFKVLSLILLTILIPPTGLSLGL